MSVKYLLDENIDPQYRAQLSIGRDLSLNLSRSSSAG